MDFKTFLDKAIADIEADLTTYVDHDVATVLYTVDDLFEADEDVSQNEILNTIDDLEWEIAIEAKEIVREFFAERFLVRYFNDGNAVFNYIKESFPSSVLESKLEEVTKYTSVKEVNDDLDSDDRNVKDEATNELLNVVYYMMIDVDFLTSYPEAERIAYEYATEVTSAAVEKLKSENVLSENVVF